MEFIMIYNMHKIMIIYFKYELVESTLFTCSYIRIKAGRRGSLSLVFFIRSAHT